MIVRIVRNDSNYYIYHSRAKQITPCRILRDTSSSLGRVSVITALFIDENLLMAYTVILLVRISN